MTPSAAYEDANRRDAGHDEMQADFGDYLRGLGMDSYKRTVHGKDVEFKPIGFYLELMLTMKGNVVGFVDIARQDCQVKKPDSRSHVDEIVWKLFEIKPRIGSAGALIRQMKAMEHIARGALSSSGRIIYDIDVIPVVCFDDPVFPLLRRMWNGFIIPWNRETKTPFGKGTKE